MTAADNTNRYRWEDGWRNMIDNTRLPAEVPACDEHASELRKRLNARRRAEQAAAMREPLPEISRQYSTKAHDTDLHDSEYLGVVYRKTLGCWVAYYVPTGSMTDGSLTQQSPVTIGRYTTADDAARARDREIIRLGIPSPLNFDRSTYTEQD